MGSGRCAGLELRDIESVVLLRRLWEIEQLRLILRRTVDSWIVNNLVNTFSHELH